MAEVGKKYPHSSGLLYNLACDIAEMHKAKVTTDTVELVCFTTEMYEQKTDYQFHLTQQPDGCLLSIETPGEGDLPNQKLSLMFAIADNMLGALDRNPANIKEP